MGVGSGGGVLFGTTGGVMEAALRTVYELVSGQPMGRIVFEDVRGLDGIKEGTVTIPISEDSPFKCLEATPGAGVSLRVAVANGLGKHPTGGQGKRIAVCFVFTWFCCGTGYFEALGRGFWEGWCKALGVREVVWV